MREEFDGDVLAMLAILVSFVLLLFLLNFLDQRHEVSKLEANDDVAVSRDELEGYQ
jgi:hypothetical protein